MNAILNLKETRADLRAALEARFKALRTKLQALDGEGWDAPDVDRRRRTDAERRALALATGQTFVPEPEPDRAALQREIDDVRLALRMHDAADRVQSAPDLQRRIDATNARVTAAATSHLKALGAVSRITPELVDALDDLRIHHLEASSISDALRLVNEVRPLGVCFRPDVEDVGQQLLAIAERAEQLVKDAAALGLKV